MVPSARHRVVILALPVALECLGCSPVAPLEEPCQQATLGTLVAQVDLQPERVPPLSSFVVFANGTATAAPELTLELGGPPLNVESVWADDGFALEASLAAPSAVGDYLVRLGGWAKTEAGCYAIEGGALLTVSDEAGCSDPNEVWEAGSCHPRIDGSPLRRDRWASFGTGTRVMAHPRETLLGDDSFLTCNTDSVALGTFDALGSGEHPPFPSPESFTETMMSTAEVEACENIAWDQEWGIGITASRGGWTLQGEFSGALSTWLLPPISEVASSTIEHAFTHLDTAGFEDIVIDDERRLYAAGKPNRLVVFELQQTGEVQQVHQQFVPGLRSAWGLALDGDRLYLTDAGGPAVQDEERHLGTEEDTEVVATGHLFVFDLSTPTEPSLTGWIDTAGPARGVAVLPDGVVGVAVGSGGVELFDVTTPQEPIRLTQLDTAGTAQDLAYSEGYLLVADWDSLLLLDASTRGALHLVGASDLAELTPQTDLTRPWQGVFAASFIALNGNQFVVSEFDRTIAGTVLAGRRGARLNLPERWIRTAKLAGDSAPLRLELHNGGTEALVVDLAVTEGSSLDQDAPSAQRSKLVLPGERSVLEVELSRELSEQNAPQIRYDSNDPTLPIRIAPIDVVDGNYAVGDQTPDFALPAVNICDESGCSTQPGCFDTAQLEGPVVLAFFSSW